MELLAWPKPKGSNDEALEPTRVAKHRKRSPGDTWNGAAASTQAANVVVQKDEAIGPQKR